MEPLLEKILSKENIYNAIYALESFVFERNLLNADDIKVYKQLEDKFNTKYINSIINKCRRKMMGMYEGNKLFEISVRYKLKSFEHGRFTFRPIHTACLIDQICMVAMLLPLMFDDAAERKPSELSKLIPHNFYGNIPSLDPEYIFVKWQLKYKEYSDAVLNHCKEYKENGKYKYEVCLDLKDFFPSINPVFICNYVFNKLRLVYANSESALKQTLVKLLYFYIDRNSINEWADAYYKDELHYKGLPSHFMVRGIAQGLPQSYYFGNIFMITAADIIAQHFPGDAYYYVDDSVIFTNNVEFQDFQRQIESLNMDLLEAQQNESKDTSNIVPYLLQEDFAFQESINYCVRCHTEDKSYYSCIDNAFDGAELSLINRQISKIATLSNNMSELDDSISLKKISSIIEVIENEIKKSKFPNDISNNRARLKMLKRNKRYFLFRQKQMQLQQDGDVSKEYLQKYYDTFMILTRKKDFQKLSDTFDEEIFQTESRMLINLLGEREADNLYKAIVSFEKKFTDKKNFECLYYKEDLKGARSFRDNRKIRYATLSQMFRSRFCLVAQSKHTIKQKEAELFLKNYDNELKKFSGDYTRLIKNTNEYNRCVLNALFSSVYGIEVNDNHRFVKLNNRRLNYTEFRTIAYLRNTHFTFNAFNDFRKKLLEPEETIYGQMPVDMALMDVLHPFIMNVKTPELIDNLILTHRLVNGLWKNGSKFLNSYTLHNEEHAIALIMQSLHIINVIDHLDIKRNDYYILFLACYLHDISMVVHPDLESLVTDKGGGTEIATAIRENIMECIKDGTIDGFSQFFIDVFRYVDSYFEEKMRRFHPEKSAEFIRSHATTFLKYIAPSILNIVAEVSESHGYDAIDVYGRKSKAKSELFSLKYMMILLRLSDLMDMSSERVNYFRLKENLNSMSSVSQFHWISHLITERADISADYEYDETKSLLCEPISENIHVRIYLNVAYRATLIRKDGCSGCLASPITSWQDEEETDRQYIQISLTKYEEGETCKNECPIICSWMMCKNNYLIKELQALQAYLKALNSRLFNTILDIQLIFSDKYPLDKEMFDIVNQYLKKYYGV